MTLDSSRFSSWAVTRRELFGAIQDADLLRIYNMDTGQTVSKPCARNRRKKWGIPRYRENIAFLRQWLLDDKELSLTPIKAEKNIPEGLILAFIERDLVQHELEKAYLQLAPKGVSPLVVYSLHLLLNGSRRPSIRWSDFIGSGDITAATELFLAESTPSLAASIRAVDSTVSTAPDSPATIRRRPGRPKGSKNKPRTRAESHVFQISLLVDGATETRMIGAADFADVVVKANQLKAAGQLRGELQGIELLGSLLL